MAIFGHCYDVLKFKNNVNYTRNNHGLVKCVRSSQPAGLHWPSQRDSKLSHEIEASGQPVQDGAQTLKSHSIQKKATGIVRRLLTSNAISMAFLKQMSLFHATIRQIKKLQTTINAEYETSYVELRMKD